MNYLHTLCGILYGILCPYILKSIGYKIGQEGIDYYAQVHESRLNSYIHTFFMPLTIYGMYLWIPRILNLSLYNSINFDICIYVAYMTHYLLINKFIGMFACVLYFIPLVFAYVTHMRINMSKIFYIGISVSTIALVIQEIFGHWISGDPPSRFEAIFNAILYAPYYSVSHIIDYHSK